MSDKHIKIVSKEVVGKASIKEQTLNTTEKVVQAYVPDVDVHSKVAETLTTPGKNNYEKNVETKLTDKTVNGNSKEPSLTVTHEGTSPWLQEPRIGRFFQEMAGLNDYISISIGFSRVLSGQASTQETLTFIQDYGREFKDESLAKVLMTFDIEKVTNDLVSAQEIFEARLEFLREYLDVISSNDQLVVNAGKRLNDVRDATDWSKKDIVTVYTDILNCHDQLTARLNAYRVFNDIADATDDVLGQADADDQQYMSFFKVVNDFADADDKLVFILQRLIQEEFSRTDVLSVQMEKLFLDASPVIDSLNVSYSKRLLDYISLTDRVSLNTATVKQDFADAVDAATLLIQNYSSEGYFEEPFTGRVTYA